MACGAKVAWVLGETPPVFSIGYEREHAGDWDSGFSVLFDDAPEPDEVRGPEDPRVSWVCMACLIEAHPEVGRGLDLARQFGAADLVDGEWVGRVFPAEDEEVPDG